VRRSADFKWRIWQIDLCPVDCIIALANLPPIKMNGQIDPEL